MFGARAIGIWDPVWTRGGELGNQGPWQDTFALVSSKLLHAVDGAIDPRVCLRIRKKNRPDCFFANKIGWKVQKLQGVRLFCCMEENGVESGELAECNTSRQTS